MKEPNKIKILIGRFLTREYLLWISRETNLENSYLIPFMAARYLKVFLNDHNITYKIA